MGTLATATILASVIGRIVKNFTSLEEGATTAAVVWFGVIVTASVLALKWGRRVNAEVATAVVPVTDPLLDRIEELRRQLAESMRLLPTLQAELELRTTALATLQEDAAHYEQLALLHREQADAVQRLVEQTVAVGNAQVERKNWRQQWGFWLAAFTLSIPVGVAVNYIYDWVSK